VIAWLFSATRHIYVGNLLLANLVHYTQLLEIGTVNDLPGKHKIDYARYISESEDILESIGYNGGDRGA
jgi:hypothetical protein